MYCIVCELLIEGDLGCPLRMWSPKQQAYVRVGHHHWCRNKLGLHATHGLAVLYQRLAEYGVDPIKIEQLPRYLGKPVVNGICLSIEPKEPDHESPRPERGPSD